LTPYAWLAGLGGTVSTAPGLQDAEINVDLYDDILGNIKIAALLSGEA